MKSWDAIIIGAGIIGVSLGIALRKRGLRVLVVERGEPGREASYAAAGMLADCTLETPPALEPLATASARMYPEFVHELEDESGMRLDLRSEGTILFPPIGQTHERPGFPAADSLPAPLAEMEPGLAARERPAVYLKERSIDPRALMAAALKAARHRGVDTSSGDSVTAVDLADARVVGVRTTKTSFLAPLVVNCAGAWAGQFRPGRVPTRPVKGQMLAVVIPRRDLLRHVVRSPEVYLVPRSDGRIVIGSTLEDAGYDKRTNPDTIHRLYRAALALVPELREARILEDWAGLRPGTPDGLPILGATATPGYYVATGHFRDGILLTPVTARAISQLVCDGKTEYDLSAFSFTRFAKQAA